MPLMPSPFTAHRVPSDKPEKPAEGAARPKPQRAPAAPPKPREIGGPEGPEPTRYGDWERKGRCIDF
jgi:hypothetical protein